MTTKISSIGLKGLEGYRVQVEVNITLGKEHVAIVGLPDTSVKEAKELVLSAVQAFGFDATDQKIIMNLSPPEQKKNGPLFDLAMAIGILTDSRFITHVIPPTTAFIGALSLDGTVEKVEGMLPALMAAHSLGYKTVVLPYDPLIPFDILDNIECIVIQHIGDVLSYLNGDPLPERPVFHSPPLGNETPHYMNDFAHIVGHTRIKKALEIAAAGGHHVLFSGPPGCGKSLLAETFPTICPPLTKRQRLEVMSLYQLAHEAMPLTHLAPFRSPHHSASSVAIIGGGSTPKPGEISLAHHGVLFLDEMAEFPKKTLDMLRQPFEAGKVTISRAQSTVTYPSSFILIAAMNPCPCGHLDSRTYYCQCSDSQITSYQNRVSGPLKDRIDLKLEVRPVSMYEKDAPRESSEVIRARVTSARERQYARYGAELVNARVPVEMLLADQPITDVQQVMINERAWEKGVSNRLQFKVIRLARTIADLAGSDKVMDDQLVQAMDLVFGEEE